MKTIKQPLILDNVSFKFNAHTGYFFKNISLTLQPNNYYFVCGKNGVGKSTFFRILQRHLNNNEQCSGTITTEGTVRLVAQDVHSMLADKLTVQENLQCALLPHYPTLHNLSQTSFPNLLAACGISAQQPVASLSGGQRQMLAITMALQKETHVLLLDEPTAALDPHNAQSVMKFIQKITQERQLIVLIISHDAELVKEYGHERSKIFITEKDGERYVTVSD